MTRYIKTAVTLFLISAVCTLLCAIVNNMTAPVIAMNNENDRVAALSAVSAGLTIGEEMEGDGGAVGYSIPLTDDSGALAGYILGLTANGYGGAMDIIASYAVDGSDLTQAPDRFATQSASSSQTLPVLYVGLEVEPPYVSGYIYTSDQRVPVPDTHITFTRDNVIYSTTSDETGAYMLYVLQNGEYKVVIEKDGYLPCEIDETVIMEGTSLQRDFEIELLTGLETARKAQCKVYVVDGICHVEAAENILSLHVISMGGSTMTAKRPAASQARLQSPRDVFALRKAQTGIFAKDPHQNRQNGQLP